MPLGNREGYDKTVEFKPGDLPVLHSDVNFFLCVGVALIIREKGVFCMKKLKRLGAILVATGLMASMACTSAWAYEPDGYVTVSVEKFSLGQGYIFEPETVPFYEYDNGIDIVKRAVGEENVLVTESSFGNYIGGFVDQGGEVILPDCLSAVVDVASLTGRAEENQLCEFDYTSESGFIFFVNDLSSSVSISEYSPADGDVISLRYSIYGYGADVGCDNSSWGGSPSLTGNVNRNEATRLIAEAKGIDIPDEKAVITDLDSSQEEIDFACESIRNKLTPEEEIPEEDDIPADTGLAVCMVSPAVFGICAILAKKRR